MPQAWSKINYGQSALQDVFAISLCFCRFPFKRPQILKLWINACRRENWTPTAHSALCAKHFNKVDYQLRPNATVPYLKENAVPSNFDFPVHLQRRPIKERKSKWLEKKLSNVCVIEINFAVIK